MARHRSSMKKQPPDIGLHMECFEEELEPSQITYYSKADKEYREIQIKLENYITKLKAEVIENSENCTVLQINAMPDSRTHAPILSSATSSKGSRQSNSQMLGQGILTRSGGNLSRNTYVVMDPTLGLVVGQVPQSGATQEQSPAKTMSKSVPGGRSRQSATSSPVMVTTRGKGSSKKSLSALLETDISSPQYAMRTREKGKSQLQQQIPSQNSSQDVPEYLACATGRNVSVQPGEYRLKLNAKQISPPIKPGENSAIGGLTVGTKLPSKQFTGEVTTSKGNADSKELTFNKVTGKTFPSLVVLARPYLKTKFVNQSKLVQERTALDAKVKSVLMYTPTKFTEWLIQQGLIRSEQSCQIHLNNDLSPVKLKLGMYSDISKFPYSGGYVWISDCCPSQFVSVFSGSIFEGAPHSPTTLLKLIYHWACQTNVQNIIQWVKVENLYIKNFFTQMRAVCTQAVREKCQKMGGAGKKIEVGVISLGTTSQDGNKRQVKVEVLGVMDYENKLVRLRAVEPFSDEKSLKRRFVRILQPIEEWVNKDSTILTDFTVNKAALNSLGFHTVFQVTSDVRYSNQNVMEYLRRIVPRMFQHTLSLLSRQIIQQFLDELVWREVWGPLPSQAFVSIIAHMAEQTKLNVSDSLLVRLSRVASNPFAEWNYSIWNTLGDNKSDSTTRQKSPSPIARHEPLAETVHGDNNQTSEKGARGRKRAAEQPIAYEIEVSPTPIKKTTKSFSKEKLKKEEKLRKPLKSVKEVGENVPEDMIKFIDEGEQIPLEMYYYGRKEGLGKANEPDDPGPGHPSQSFNVRCCVCRKRFTDNIILMKHMILHCQGEPELRINLKNVHQCSNCFLGFNTDVELISHKEQVHCMINNKLECNFMCHICEIKFSSRILLVHHMQKTHVAKEMPYECGICYFRTSVYRFFVQHFDQTHKGGEQVYCPYCLKVITLWHKEKEISLNVEFYMSHLEKHKRLSLIKVCDSCQLSFIHEAIWEQHMEADHSDWENAIGVEFPEELHTGLLMPKPGGLLKPSTNVKLFKSPTSKNLYMVNKWKSMEVLGVDENLTCIECEAFFVDSRHFSCNLTCLKCRYETCCERAMAEHVATFHEFSSYSQDPCFTVGRPTILPKEMYCICGFSSASGNRLAKHLALCERKSAYSSMELVDDALEVVPVEVTSMDSPKGEGQNVLNMLGLVRKSPEVISASGVLPNQIEIQSDGGKQTEVLEIQDDVAKQFEGNLLVCHVDEGKDEEKNADMDAAFENKVNSGTFEAPGGKQVQGGNSSPDNIEDDANKIFETKTDVAEAIAEEVQYLENIDTISGDGEKMDDVPENVTPCEKLESERKCEEIEVTNENRTGLFATNEVQHNEALLDRNNAQNVKEGTHRTNGQAKQEQELIESKDLDRTI